MTREQAESRARRHVSAVYPRGAAGSVMRETYVAGYVQALRDVGLLDDTQPQLPLKRRR